MSTSPLRGRGRRLWTQQLPPGAPPDWAPPGRSQPMPTINRMAQVFSTYAAAPIGARMFAESITESASNSGGVSTWLFDLDVPRGFVRVLRGVRLLPRRYANVGIVGRTHFRLSTPGGMTMQIRLNKMPPPQVASADGDSLAPLANHGELWPVYLIANEQDTVGLRVTADPEWSLGYTDLTAVFYGDMLKARSLPKELEVGHEAALVKVSPQPNDAGGQ